MIGCVVVIVAVVVVVRHWIQIVGVLHSFAL